MKEAWPPSPPAERPCGDALMQLKEHVRCELHERDLSDADKSLTQYMRRFNFAAGLVNANEGPYRGRMTLSFDTVTDRVIRPKLLRVLRPSTEEDGVFVIPADVAHIAANNMTKRGGRVLADELVGGFYEQYDMARAMGRTKHFLRKISPERYEDRLRLIYEQVRERSLDVLRGE